MISTKVFNPEHDMALANGDKHFIAPRNIREMAHDLAPLLEFVEEDGVLVWGWDHAIKSQLLRMGVAAETLPTDGALTALRQCSERASAHRLLHAFHADHPDGPYIGESILAHSLNDVAAYASRHGHIILKDPLSSSGKGLRHVNKGGLPLSPSRGGGTPDNSKTIPKEPLQGSLEHSKKHCPSKVGGRAERNEMEQSGGGMYSSSSPLGKIENWANALIRRHGYLTAEPYYNKVQDFAMEYCVREGQCRFIGYSLFNTNAHGRYESNLLMEDEKIETLLAQYIPHSALHEVRDWVISHFTHIIPAEWDTPHHPLYFGIDMMVVKTTDNRQRTTDDRQQTTDKVCANERESSSLEFSQRVQPKLNNEVINGQQTTDRVSACECYVNLHTNPPASAAELKTKFTSELKIQNSEFKLYPCVEINLRLNMGIIAHEVRRALLAPGTEGTFHVTAFPTEEAAQRFYQEHIEQFPPLFQAEKIVSGYYPLTPIHSHTRHHAYIVCRKI